MAQHGLVTRVQARGLGFSDSAIGRATEGGRLRRMHTGVYAMGGVPPTWRQRVLAACMAGGPDVVASHRTAARLWGIVGTSGTIEVLVDGTRRVRVPAVTVHQSYLLDPEDLTEVSSIPVTSMARTIVDAAGGQRPEVAGRWVDEAIRTRGFDIAELRAVVARLAGPGRRNLRPVRLALAERLPGYDPGDSELEVRAMRALRSAGLAQPAQQHRVDLPDGKVARLDLSYPLQRICIELDGWAFHGDRQAFEHDRHRRNLLTLLGWTVFQFTARSSDEWLVEMVREALATPIQT